MSHVFVDEIETLDLLGDLDLEGSEIRKIEAYQRGRLKGMFWPDIWEGSEPGGPWMHDEQTRQENALWRQGWKEGHREKLSSGRQVSYEEYKIRIGGEDDAR